MYLLNKNNTSLPQFSRQKKDDYNLTVKTTEMTKQDIKELMESFSEFNTQTSKLKKSAVV